MKVNLGNTHRSDDGNAFMPDPAGGHAWIDDALAEELAEEFVWTVTGSDELPTEHKKWNWRRGGSRHHH